MSTPEIVPLQPEGLPLSVCVIATESDAHYMLDLLRTIPNGSEVVVLWNSIGEVEEPTVHRKTKTYGNTVVRYYKTVKTKLHFANLRNECIALATRPWIMWLDADDRLMVHQHDFFKRLNEYPPGIGGLTCGCVGSQPKYTGNEFDDSLRYHVPTVRLFRNGYGFQFEGAAHEQIGWSIDEAGFRAAPCSLIVHHVGYEISADKMKAKLERNVKLLSTEYASCDDQRKLSLWSQMLARDSQHLQKYQG
jgi:hypothetical protein